MSDLPLQENHLLSPVPRPLGPEVFELWFNNRANDDRDWLTPKGAVLYRLIWKRWLTSLSQHSNIDGQAMCRIPDDHKDAYETGLAENRTSPS